MQFSPLHTIFSNVFMKRKILPKKFALTVTIMIGFFLLYYITGEISEIITPEDSDISVVWFPGGVATAAFLCVPKNRWFLLFSGFLILNLVIGDFDNKNVALSLLFSFFALLPCIVIAWTVRKYSLNKDSLYVVLLWLSVTLLVSFADAVLFSSGMAWLNNESFSKLLFWDGFFSDVTGNIFSITVIMGIFNRYLKKHHDWN